MPDKTITILNLSPAQALGNTDSTPVSVGIHPWYIGADWQKQLDLLTTIAQQQRVVMIGEAGLDKLCATDFELQKEVYLKQVELAERLRKPLIIHCVKAWQEILVIHKGQKPTVPCIIHGFRGKPELAEQLLAAGFYLSFGEHFNEESVRKTPLNRLCTETDESRMKIEDIYSKIAIAKDINILTLQDHSNTPLRKTLQVSNFINIHSHEVLL